MSDEKKAVAAPTTTADKAKALLATLDGLSGCASQPKSLVQTKDALRSLKNEATCIGSLEKHLSTPCLCCTLDAAFQRATTLIAQVEAACKG